MNKCKIFLGFYFLIPIVTSVEAIAWYKVCKRKVNKLSQFSNAVCINIIPQATVNNYYQQINVSSSENENALYQNYSNPFYPATIITFRLHESDLVIIKLYKYPW